jgi:hypothetical protein
MFLSIVMKGALGAMYTMINSFQMVMSYSLLNVSTPANVLLVMTNLKVIATFDYLPTEKIMGFCFTFTATVMPSFAFQSMGYFSLRLTLFLGSMIIFTAVTCAQSFLFLITWPLTKKYRIFARYNQHMSVNYYWRGIIRLILE